MVAQVRDPFFDRGLPNAVQAEQAILGAILLDSSVIFQAVELLNLDDFFLDSSRRIFSKMCALAEAEKPIDFVTLTDALRDAGEFEQIGGATHLASLIDGVPRTDNVSHYAVLVKEKSQLRNLIRTGNQIIARAVECEDPVSEIVQSAERSILEIGRLAETGGFVPAGAVGERVSR